MKLNFARFQWRDRGIYGRTQYLNTLCLILRPNKRITFDKMHTIGDDKAWISQLLKNVCGASSILLPCKRCSSQRTKKQKKNNCTSTEGNWLWTVCRSAKEKVDLVWLVMCFCLRSHLYFLWLRLVMQQKVLGHSIVPDPETRNAETAFMAPVGFFFLWVYRARWGIAQRIINK